MKVLLVEPNYKNKYPPLGLMKISKYHKELNHEVYFVKGKNEELRTQKWDRIYISTLFTFYYNITINTIKYYLNSVKDQKQIFVGGPMATLKKDEIQDTIGFEGINVITGLLDQAGILDDNDYIIDSLTPDYTILSNDNMYLNYRYPVSDSYFIHITHGCIRKCSFCAVPVIEPKFIDYCEFSHKIRSISDEYGEMRDLRIMDNNILASNSLDSIINELIGLGYYKGNKSYKKNNRSFKRSVDFNQGLDARLLYANKEIMEKLSKIEINPMRVAFDHANPEFVNIYKTVMIQAHENQIENLSNYILFNLDDSPKDLFARLRINIELNVRFKNENSKTSIWSFPMKFTPIFGEHSKDRKYIGTSWNRKKLRAVQCLLIPTHGVVGPKLDYFEHAFGKDLVEFEKIIQMPENFIINRKINTVNGNIGKWNHLYDSLDSHDLFIFSEIISDNLKRNIKIYLDETKNISDSLCEILNMYLLV